MGPEGSRRTCHHVSQLFDRVNSIPYSLFLIFYSLLPIPIFPERLVPDAKETVSAQKRKKGRSQTVLDGFDTSPSVYLSVSQVRTIELKNLYPRTRSESIPPLSPLCEPESRNVIKHSRPRMKGYEQSPCLSEQRASSPSPFYLTIDNTSSRSRRDMRIYEVHRPCSLEKNQRIDGDLVCTSAPG